MSLILETERLRFCEFTVEDHAFVAELVNSPGWLKFIGERNVKTPDQARAYLENGPIKSYRDHGFGLWLVALLKTEEPIGMCGLLWRDQLDHPDIGFAFLPAFTGNGFALEAAQATRTYAHDKLNLPTLCAIVMAENKTSIKLLEKIGMKFSKPIRLADDKEELLLYSTHSKDLQQ